MFLNGVRAGGQSATEELTARSPRTNHLLPVQCLPQLSCKTPSTLLHRTCRRHLKRTVEKSQTNATNIGLLQATNPYHSSRVKPPSEFYIPVAPQLVGQILSETTPKEGIKNSQ